MFSLFKRGAPPKETEAARRKSEGDRLLQEGDVAGAIAAYRLSLQEAPDFEPALLEYCRLLAAQGRLDEAAQLARDGLRRLPQCVLLHLYLGNIAFEMGDAGSAIESFENGLALQPENPALLGNLVSARFAQGNVLLAQRRYDEAAAAYGEVLRRQERHFGALFQFAYLCQEQGNFEQATGYLQRALAVEPDSVDAMINLGACLRRMGRLAQALQHLEAALALQPERVQAIDEIGIVNQEAGNFEEAVRFHRRAAQIAPDRAETYSNLGLALQLQNKLDEAEQALRHAAALDPGLTAAHINLGVLLNAKIELTEALACFDRALAIEPESAIARKCRSVALLLQGDFARGWPEYEYRWLEQGAPKRIASSQPLWLGQADLAGKTILLYAEQGYGDSLQFVRYASLAAQRRATVLLHVPQALKTLFARCPGVAQVLVNEDAVPPYDYHCPLLSLPLAFGTELSGIPAQIPYLTAAPEKAAHWKGRLAPDRGLRVGLIWAGEPRRNEPKIHTIDKMRSLHFDQFRPLLAVPGVHFYSLQVGGETAAQLDADAPVADYTAEFSDFHDTAAFMENLDLVISADTSSAHLAGALGVRVWLLNRYNTCWRWLLGRDDSPWYPTMRLFRQHTPGDWESVVAEVARALAQEARARGKAD